MSPRSVLITIPAAALLLCSGCKAESETERLGAQIDKIEADKKLSNRRLLERIAGVVWRDAGPTKHRISLRPGGKGRFRLFVVVEPPWNGRVSKIRDGVTVALLGGQDPGDVARCRLVMTRGSKRGLEEILFARRWIVLVGRKRRLVLVEPFRVRGPRALPGWPPGDIGELGAYHLLVSKTKRRFELTKDELDRLAGPAPDAGRDY